MILKKLAALADILDQKGLYKEAGELDAILSLALPDNDDPLALPPVEDWEMAMMEMDLSPEEREKQEEYMEKEIPTDEEAMEEMLFRERMRRSKDWEGDAPADILHPGEGYPEKNDDDDADDPLDFKNFNPGQEALRRLKQKKQQQKQAAGHSETSYYLIEDDTWRIVPQTGFANSLADGEKLWEYYEGDYSLVERKVSPMERTERIIKPGKYLLNVE